MLQNKGKTSLPRSLLAIRKARPFIEGATGAFGNAPVALMELSRMIIEERIKPAVIIAMPVGFVQALCGIRDLHPATSDKRPSKTTQLYPAMLMIS